MSIIVGISGFGRIGRAICRLIFETPPDTNNPITIGAINSSKSPEYLAYLLKYDTVHGCFAGQVDYTEDKLIVNNVSIPIVSHRNPSEIPWKKYNIKYVCECTGVFNTKETAKQHIDHDNGAEYVILSCPPKDDMPMYVMGVNENDYKSEKIVSCASCTTNCLAPLIKIIHDKYGVKDALMTTVHASTSSQSIVDSSAKNGKNWRLGRATIGNIIPTTTGAAKAVGKVIPELEGKITGMSLRIPTLNVSVVDVTCNLETGVSQQELFEYIKTISNTTRYNKFIGWTEQPIVSTDFVGDKRSSIIDLNASICLNDKFIKMVSWYDNEKGYSNRMLDLIMHMHNHTAPTTAPTPDQHPTNTRPTPDQ